MPLVLLLLLTIPFYRALTLPIGNVYLSSVDIIGMLAGLYIGTAFLLGRPLAFPSGGFGIALGLYLFAIGGSIIDAYSRERALHYFAAIVLNIVLFLTVYQAMRSARRLRFFSGAYCIAAATISFFAVLQSVAFLSGGAMESVAGTLTVRNEMVFLILPGFAIALANSFSRGPRRLLYIGCAILILAAIIVSRGRAGMVFAIALIVIVPLLVHRQRGIRAFEPLLIWTLLLGASAALFATGPGGELFARYTRTLQAEVLDQRGSAWTRLELVRSAYAAYRSSPVFGIGADNFKLTSGYFVESSDPIGVHNLSEIQPHSTYVGALAETGLLGLAGFLGLILSGLLSLRTLKHALPEDRAVLGGVLAAFGAVAVHLLVFDAGARPTTWIFLAVALATREIAPGPRFRPLVLRLSG